MTHSIHFLDVFAERRYAGNQLAVVLDADDLATEEMQAIALETNFSETTFVLSRSTVDGGYPVRIFTPAQELPFAGHPTLGTAWLIREEFEGADAAVVRLNLGVGQIEVAFEAPDPRALGFLRAPLATFGETVPAEVIAPAVGLEKEDIEDRVPTQQVTAGLDFVVIPVRSAEALRRSRLDSGALHDLRDRGIQPFTYLFCPEPDSADNDLAARFFFDANGVREDPATGSATCALGGYLLHHDYFSTQDLDLRIEQGALAGRPSLLHLRTKAGENEPEIEVGGHVVELAHGEVLQ